MEVRRTSKGLRAAVALAFLVSTLASARAYADVPAADASAAQKAEAAELFKQGADAYRQGDFKRTIELLDKAYTLDPQPVLVYNRARAEEGLGNLDEAIRGYETFLAQEPNATDRGAIEQRLVALRRLRDERAAAAKEREDRKTPAPAPASHPPPEPAAEPSRRNVLPYVMAGVGAAGLATGTILGFVALSKNDDAIKEPTQLKAVDLKDSADGLATVSTVSFIIGGALLAAGATWWLLDTKAAKRKTARGVVPSVTISGFRCDFL